MPSNFPFNSGNTSATALAAQSMSESWTEQQREHVACLCAASRAIAGRLCTSGSSSSAPNEYQTSDEHFRYWRQTVRRARRIGNYVMSSRIVLLFIYSQNDRDVFVFGGRRDDDFLYRPSQMLLCIFRFGENPGRLDHDLCADRFPIDRGRIPLRKNSKLFVFDLDSVFSGQ